MRQAQGRKVSAAAVCLYVILLVLRGGCSREEPPSPPEEADKVVMPIKSPAPEQSETPIPPMEKAPTEAEQPGQQEMAASREEPSGMDTKEPETQLQKEPGYYTVREGDTLATIAGREEVYGDPLKWPILYRHNMKKIGQVQLVDDFLDRELVEGVKLKVIAPDQARETLPTKVNHLLAVNVLSAPTQEQLISSAIRLMREGYPVYITRATVKGRQWLRLRVGFFQTKAKADLMRKKINGLLNIRNSWVATVGKKELEGYTGYFD